MKIIANPIIPGNYPDPSICRVGDDYYLVCSSFELCPGLPVFHSRDLANWEQISNAMSAEQGLKVYAWACVGGLMAPTIRYCNGTFYILNSNMSRGSNCNYIITATNPAGPWSAPTYLPDVPNIDASIFFDDDGSCYLVGTGMNAKRSDGSEGRCIWICPFDTGAMKLKGEPKAVWDSALRGASSPEAPHIFKKNGWYYLLIAEGGTEHYHSITVGRSRDILGWYEYNPSNPILTHRHLGQNYPICNVGHGDFVETPDGRWYCVMLASRLIDGYHKNLGRETFICPMTWERDWPVLCPGEGRVLDSYPAPEQNCHPFPAKPVREDFDCAIPELNWVFWGTPSEDFYRFADSKLHLRCLPRTFHEPIRPLGPDRKPDEYCHTNISGLFTRQSNLDVEFSTKMTFLPAGSESAGIVILQAINHSLCVERYDGGIRVLLTETQFNRPPFIPGYEGQSTVKVLAQTDWSEEDTVLAFRIHRQNCEILYGRSEADLHLLCTVDLKLVTPAHIGGFSGNLFGLYASGNGTVSSNEAVFHWADYKPL